MEEQKSLLDISWGTIFKVSAAIVSFYFLFQIRNLLMSFVFAVVISILFEPAVIFLRKFKIPRVLAVPLLYIGFFGLMSLMIYSTVPLFSSEVAQFSKILPDYFERISPLLKGLGIAAFEDVDTAIKTLEGVLNNMAGNILSALFMIFGGIMTTIFVLTISAFISLEEKGVEKNLVLLFPSKHESYILSLWRRCEKKISNWFLVRLAACFFVGAASYIAFLALNIQYPFILGLVAGAFNFIPIVGPVATAVLLFATTAVDSVLKAVFVVVVFTLIQQVENNILTPILSKKLVDLSPVLVLMSLAVGGALWGFLGAILATPLVGILFEFLTDYLKEKRGKEIEATP